jgi:hypothetical protein
MDKPPDLEDLACRYVELWQDQIAEAALDPELVEALMRPGQLAGGGMAAILTLWQRFWADLAAAAPTASGAYRPPGFSRGDHDGHDRAAPDESPPAAAASRAAAAAGPSAVGRDHLVQLAPRLAALEKRLAVLEARDRPARRRARRRARRYNFS